VYKFLCSIFAFKKYFLRKGYFIFFHGVASYLMFMIKTRKVNCWMRHTLNASTEEDWLGLFAFFHEKNI